MAVLNRVVTWSIGRPRIFYGWWIVAGSVLTALYVGGVIFYGFTAVFEPISQELGWSYTQISAAASLRGLEMSLLAPFIGLAVDRWGPRKMLILGVFSTAAGLILLSRVTSIGMFYAAFFLLALGMSGCSMEVLSTTTAYWFKRKIGLASGIALSGYGFSGLVVLVMVKLIDAYGWRQALVILGIGVVVVILPVSLLFRHRPEQYGYLPDGDTKESLAARKALSHQQVNETDVSAKQALRSWAFWGISLAFIVHSLLVNAIVTHLMPGLTSVGVVRSTAALVIMVMPLVSIVGRLGFGWLADKFNRKLITAAAFIMLGLGTLAFGHTSSVTPWPLVLFIILFGTGYGALNTLRPALVRGYFGIAHFGAIFGLIIGVNFVGNIAGPVVAGWWHDRFGSYSGIWLIFAILPVVAAVLILMIRPVRAMTERKNT